jgi:predicted ATPase with chaperone activity
MTERIAEPQQDRPVPRMIEAGGTLAPAAPLQFEDAGVSRDVLMDLLLKAAFTVPQFTTEWAVQQLRVPQPLVADLLEELRVDHLIEVLGAAGPFGFRYSVAQRGRERAARLLEISGYIGPAPVSLAAYRAMLDWHLANVAPVSIDQIRASLSSLVLATKADYLAGLAVSSRRSLFIYGPPGNGKTALARLLHQALEGDLWIPYCIAVESNIIRVFDPQVHEQVPLEADQPWLLDNRWVRVKRPFIVVGGEATI